jgi:CheY-like chemotaxis protein
MYVRLIAVEMATDAVEATKMMHSNARYEVVLIDDKMPSLDGVVAAANAREFDHSTPFHADLDQYIFIINGKQGYLPKPLQKSDLDQVLQRWCNWKWPLKGDSQFTLIDDSHQFPAPEKIPVYPNFQSRSAPMFPYVYQPVSAQFPPPRSNAGYYHPYAENPRY